jgi:hypothetical protein
MGVCTKLRSQYSQGFTKAPYESRKTLSMPKVSPRSSPRGHSKDRGGGGGGELELSLQSGRFSARHCEEDPGLEVHGRDRGLGDCI